MKIQNKLIASTIITFVITTLLISCSNSIENDNLPSNNNDVDLYTLVGEHHFVSGYEPNYADGDINVVIEIPTGTTEKWEVDKETGNMKWEFVNDIPRIVDYIGYPGNYGMVPQTILPENLGGDGDPLDVLVLGPAVKRGSVIKCKLIGVLKLLDDGEQDDKLIAVMPGTNFYDLNTMDELFANYIGVSNIVQLWFTNYKGPGRLESNGFGEKDEAETILENAISSYLSLP